MGDDPDWSWVEENGVEHRVGENELTFALSSEAIPAHTLVSHVLWADWLPAMQVAELTWALPSGHADTPHKPRLLEGSAKKEPPPLQQYAELRQRARDIVSGHIDLKAEAAAQQPKPSAASKSLSPELDLGAVVDAELDAVLDNLDAALGGLVEDSRPTGLPEPPEDVTRVHRPGEIEQLLAAARGGGGQAEPSSPVSAKPPSSGASAVRRKLPSDASIAKSGAARKEMHSSSGIVLPAPTRGELSSSPGLRLPSAPRREQPSGSGLLPAPRREQSSSSGLLPAPRREQPSVSGLPAPRREQSSGSGLLPAPRREQSSSSGLPAPRREQPSAGSLPAPRREQSSSSGLPAPRGEQSSGSGLSATPRAESTQSSDVPQGLRREQLVDAGLPQAPQVEEPPLSEPLSTSEQVSSSRIPPEPQSFNDGFVPRPSLSSSTDLSSSGSTSSGNALAGRLSRPSIDATLVSAFPSARGEANFRKKSGAVLWLFAALGLAAVAGGAWFVFQPKDQQPVAPAVSAAAPTASAAPTVWRAACQKAGEPQRIFDFAKPEVKPVFGVAQGSRVALGFAQTSRMAVGINLSAADLSASVELRADEPSPMLSVVPTLRGSTPEFLIERAASTLQTARAVAANPPLAIGLKEKTIAVRRDKKDVTLWDSPWETLSVPEIFRLSAESHVLAVRAGGQRGSILLGKVSEKGETEGPLVALKIDALRIGEPSLSVADGRVMVALDGGPTNALGQLFVGVSASPELPSSAERVPEVGDDASLPNIAVLPNGNLFLQWSQGAIGSQQIVGRAFDSALKPQGEVQTLSQAGADAHHSVSTLVGDRLISVYFVRVGNNHELWASTLVCRSEAQ